MMSPIGEHVDRSTEPCVLVRGGVEPHVTITVVTRAALDG
jgi:hypothetical protein